MALQAQEGEFVMNTMMRRCPRCYTPLVINEWTCRTCGMSYFEPATTSTTAATATSDMMGTMNPTDDISRFPTQPLHLREIENASTRKKAPRFGLLLSVLFLIIVMIGGGSLLLVIASGAIGGSSAMSNSSLSTGKAATPRVATATPGIGVLAVSSKWGLTLTRVHLENMLSNQIGGFGGSTYTPKSGYTFLVLDMLLQNLDSSKELSVSSDMFAIINSTGQIATPDLVASGVPATDYYAGVSSISTTSKELNMSIGFVITQTSVGQMYKLQFSSVPLIPFTAH
jgi:hypothetical protein